jgi:antitoxin (DNA-binding transcriptional repressor) of toxin-antitoxin stability system
MGEEFVIFSRGKPIAKIQKVEDDLRGLDQAKARLLGRLKEQPLVAGAGRWRRDDLYDEPQS